MSFLEFDAARPAGKIVATSGGFDPIHPGHISSLRASAAYGDVVVVIVNGDAFLAAKKGKPFQDLATRSLIVSAIRGVDYVVPFEIENDTTVREALRRLRPAVFTKGRRSSRPRLHPGVGHLSRARDRSGVRRW